MLHDWIFVSFDLNWVIGEARIIVRDPTSRNLCITAGSVRAIRMSRMFDWGPSSSILSFRQSKSEGEVVLARMDIQSGDFLEIECSSVEGPAEMG
jgi:hypothetical protein